MLKIGETRSQYFLNFLIFNFASKGFLSDTNRLFYFSYNTTTLPLLLLPCVLCQVKTFKESVYELFGYSVTCPADNQYSLLSVFAESQDNTILFSK